MVVQTSTSHPKVPGWKAAAQWLLHDGRITLMGLQFTRWIVEGMDPSPGASLQRYLRLSDLEAGLEHFLSSPYPVGIGPPDAWRVAKFAETPRPGRRGRSDLYLARWAKRYVDACNDPASEHRPVAALVERFDGTDEHISTSALRAVLGRAKDRKLLRGVRNGTAGGELTAKALKLLENEGEF